MKSKVVVVTGGFGTLGRAVAQEAALRGAQVALVDVAATPASPPAAPDGTAFGLYPGVDLQQPEAAAQVLAQIADTYGQIDGLANVAGGFVWQMIGDGDDATWDRLYGQNVRTTLNMSKAAVPHLLKLGAGAIVNVGANGALKAANGMGAYAASKSGVHRLTEALAEELKQTGVRVNAVLPSIIDTAPNRADMPDADFTQWVTPVDLARVILFLLSDESRAVTGALLPVTGRV